MYNFNSVQLTFNECVFNRIQYRPNTIWTVRDSAMIKWKVQQKCSIQHGVENGNSTQVVYNEELYFTAASPLFTFHFPLFTSPLFTSPLFTFHFSQHRCFSTFHFFTLRFSLSTFHFSLSTFHYTAASPLFTFHFFTLHFPLFTLHFSLHRCFSAFHFPLFHSPLFHSPLFHSPLFTSPLFTSPLLLRFSLSTFSLSAFHSPLFQGMKRVETIRAFEYSCRRPSVGLSDDLGR